LVVALIKDVFRIPEFGYESNVYVFNSDKKAVIIDSGMGFYVGGLIRAINRLKLREKKILLILTHAHFDHIGGVYFLRKKLDMKVMMHKVDAIPVELGDARVTAAYFLTGAERIPPLKVDHKLADNERIVVDDWNFRIIHTPGHTAGSICIFEEKTRTLASGDTIFSKTIGRTDLPTGNFRQLINSIKKISMLRVENLLPGHGHTVLGDAGERIREIFNATHESIEKKPVC